MRALDDPELECLVNWENLLAATAHHAYRNVLRLRRLEASGRQLTFDQQKQMAEDEHFLAWVAPDLRLDTQREREDLLCKVSRKRKKARTLD